MCRGFIRTPSFSKMVGAYRSQWKRSLMRLFTLGLYGRKGIGWWKDPQKAWYNFWYNSTTVSLTRLLGFKPSRGSRFFALLADILRKNNTTFVLFTLIIAQLIMIFNR